MLKNKSNIRILCGIIISMVIGFAVFSEFYFAAVVAIPIMFYFVKNFLDGERPLFGLFLANFFLLIFCAYAAAMMPFIVPAIRDFARTSLSISIIFSVLIILMNTIPYFLPVVALIFMKQQNRFLFFGFIFCAASALWPNMGNLTIGDALGMYSVFHPIIRTIGISGLTFFAHLFILGLIYFSYKNLRFKLLAWTTVYGTVLVGGCTLFDSKLNPPLVVHSQQTVSLVQAINLNDPMSTHQVHTEKPVDFTKKILDRITKHNQSHISNLAILPEGGLSTGISFPWDTKVKQRRFLGTYTAFDEFAEQSQMNLLVVSSNAVISADQTKTPGVSAVAVLLSKHGGQWINFIYKNHLVPFMEYVPGEAQFPFLKKLFSWTWATPSDLESDNFRVDDMNFRALICYDSLFAEPYWQAIQKGAEFLVAMTNNSYLKGGSHFQYAITRSRVLEFGRPLLYVGNYADSGVISDTTATKHAANEFAIIDVKLSELSSRDTFYSRVIFPRIQSFGSNLIFCFYLLVFSLLMGTGIRWFRTIKTPRKVQIRGYVAVGTATLLIYYLFSKYVLQFVYIPTASMYPAIEPQSKKVVCRFQHNYKRGQIVSAHFGLAGESVVKRIILLPGERILKNNRILKANGEIAEIQYKQPTEGEHFCKEVIEDLSWQILCSSVNSLINFETEPLLDNQYFLLGDNRENSTDSRAMGPVPIENLKGALCLF